MKDIIKIPTTARKASYTELRDALDFMLNQAGHLEEDYPGDYDFSNERAVLEQADAEESDAPEHLFKKAVALRIGYWDTVRALEQAVAEDGEFTDNQNDEVNDLIDSISAGASTGLTLEEAYDSVGDDHFADLTDILKD